jgi:hypothetical protein
VCSWYCFTCTTMHDGKYKLLYIFSSKKLPFTRYNHCLICLFSDHTSVSIFSNSKQVRF